MCLQLTECSDIGAESLNFVTVVLKEIDTMRLLQGPLILSRHLGCFLGQPLTGVHRLWVLYPGRDV